MSGTYTLQVVPHVNFDIAEHAAFLESRRIGLGDQLRDEIDIVYDRLEENPCLFQKRHGEYRVAQTKRLHYKMLYRIIGKSVVRIVAVRHPRQHPTSWMSRL